MFATEPLPASDPAEVAGGVLRYERHASLSQALLSSWVRLRHSFRGGTGIQLPGLGNHVILLAPETQFPQTRRRGGRRAQGLFWVRHGARRCQGWDRTSGAQVLAHKVLPTRPAPPVPARHLEGGGVSGCELHGQTRVMGAAWRVSLAGGCCCSPVALMAGPQLRRCAGTHWLRASLPGRRRRGIRTQFGLFPHPQLLTSPALWACNGLSPPTPPPRRH